MKIEINNPQYIWELGQRANQEDAIFPKAGEATAEDHLFILCDGMGGHEHGEVASQTISSGMAEYLKAHFDPSQPLTDDTILQALETANEQLDTLDDGAQRKMGTTLTLLCFHRGGLTVAHIGDSRIYHVRPGSNTILYKSRDHSLVYDLYQAGEITAEEMKTSPQKNIITRAIMPGKANRVKPDIAHITNIQPGDYFYICSDGMLEQMEDDELVGILAAEGTDDDKREKLIEATSGNKDNHSAYLVHIASVAVEQGDDQNVDDEATTLSNALNIVPVEKPQDDVEIVGGDVQEAIPYQQPQPTQPLQPVKKKRSTSLTILAIALIAVAAIVVVLIVKTVSGGKEKAEPQQTERNEYTPPTGNSTIERPASRQVREQEPTETGNSNQRIIIQQGKRPAKAPQQAAPGKPSQNNANPPAKIVKPDANGTTGKPQVGGSKSGAGDSKGKAPVIKKPGSGNGSDNNDEVKGTVGA